MSWLLIVCVSAWWENLLSFFDSIMVQMFRYPLLSLEDSTRECPFCRGYCNCNACVCSTGPKRVSNFMNCSSAHGCVKSAWLLLKLSPFFLILWVGWFCNQPDVGVVAFGAEALGTKWIRREELFDICSTETSSCIKDNQYRATGGASNGG